jgi:hypothetical protein
MKLSIRLQNHGKKNHPLWYLSPHSGGSSSHPTEKISSAATFNTSDTGALATASTSKDKSSSTSPESSTGCHAEPYPLAKSKSSFPSGTSSPPHGITKVIIFSSTESE